MCGIVAYIGKRPATSLLIEGLRRLEYRGYDSSGLSTIHNGRIETRKKVGRIDNLASLIREKPIEGQIGISHTRWATHGAPSDANAHPHLDGSGKISVIHNGVIENYQSLKERLIGKGHKFLSDTDTEVLAHLIQECFEQTPPNGERRILEAVRSALKQVTGTYGIAVLSADYPNLLIGARRGSPLVIGIGKNENFLSSDVSAFVTHTRDAVFLNDFDIAMIKADDFSVEKLDEKEAKVCISKVEEDSISLDKGSFPNYMLKEIFDQPLAMENAMRGRLNREESSSVLGGLNMSNTELRNVDRIIMTACGTSWHAALVGEYLIEEYARVPCEVEYASEFRYRNPPMDKHTLLFAITQSGETADTLAAMREARRKGYRALGICNVVGSTIARESDGGIYLRAGPEIGVASTKAFTSQVTILALIALHLGRLHHMSSTQGSKFIDELVAIPGKIKQILELSDKIKKIAEKYANAKDFLFLGRQFNYPVALEGALKLKEISYIHAEGYPAAEMKHGPIALIDEQTPSMVLCPKDSIYDKTMSNVSEVKARKGKVIAVATEGDKEIASKVDDVIYIPSTIDQLYPLLTNIPLQLFAYHTAMILGRDVDKPRNLAKSVTVE